jgi:hypothetical protein
MSKKPSIFEVAASKPDPENYPLATVIRMPEPPTLTVSSEDYYLPRRYFRFILDHFPRTRKRRIQRKCRSHASAWFYKYCHPNFAQRAQTTIPKRYTKE